MNLFAVYTKLGLKYVWGLSWLLILVSFFLFSQFLKPVLEEEQKTTTSLFLSISYFLVLLFYTIILMIQWRLSPQLQIFDPAYSLLNYVFYGMVLGVTILFVSLFWQTSSARDKMTNRMLIANTVNLVLLLVVLSDIVKLVFFHPFSIVLELKHKKTLEQRKQHLNSFLCQKKTLTKQQYKALQQHWRNLEFADTSFQQYLQKKHPCPKKFN